MITYIQIIYWWCLIGEVGIPLNKTQAYSLSITIKHEKNNIHIFLTYCAKPTKSPSHNS